MKKKIILMLAVLALSVTGCKNTADLITPEEGENEVVSTVQPTIEPEEIEEPKTTIPLTQTLKMTNEWTIIGDYDFAITTKGKKDRIVLATSAKTKNGEIMWDDSQYWTLAVISEEGAYNLFSERMSGYAYMEVSEAFIKGMPTPVVTAYIFSGNDREIRNYIFEDDVFVEYREFTTKQFSTGGLNNRYTTFPEPSEK